MILVALSQNKECIQAQQYFGEDEKVIIKNNFVNLGLDDLLEMTEFEYEKLVGYKQIDICTPPTDKERIIKLEEEKSILAENVYQLAGIIEAMLGDGNNG